MLRIEKGNQDNQLIVTLNEKTENDLSEVVYLWELKNNTTNQSFFFIAFDTSQKKERYNRFRFYETNTPELVVIPELNGIPEFGCGKLSPMGIWNYFVRDQVSKTNLDPELSGNIVESGIVEIIGVQAENVVYNENEKSKVVYNG